MPRPRWCILTFLVAIAACSGESGQGADTFDVRLPLPQTMVSLASDLIGTPNDIAVDDSGGIWIVDPKNHRLVVIDPDGGEPRFVGREGQGPGEFRGPARIMASDTLIRVIDAVNSRVQDYHPDGTSLGDHVISNSMIGGGALLPGGRIVIPTTGQNDALAQIHDLAGSAPVPIGAPVVPPSVWDFTAMKQAIAEGGVPAQFRNMVTPIAGESGALWLLVQTESEVRRYSTEGEHIWSRVLEVPEVEEARRDFFQRNSEEESPWGIHPLSTMAAAQELNGRLWILMQSEARSTLAVFYILDGESGDLLGRVSVGVPSAANAFAIDPNRGRLYLTIPDQASVLAADLTGVEY